MAAAVCEAIEAGPAEWRDIDLDVVPGVTAMLAVAARIGAPLGHDFCAISLSDNLKPGMSSKRRLELAAEAGFVIALYNPISKARPWQLGQAFEILRGDPAGIDAGDLRPRRRPAGRAHRRSCRLAMPMPARADMATCVIIGSPETRIIERGDKPALVYTPRFIAGRQQMIDQFERCLDSRRPSRHPAGCGRRDHDHLDAERARRGDLAVGRVAAAVLGDDDVDAMCFASRVALVGLVERAARQDVARVGQRRAAARPDRRCG